MYINVSNPDYPFTAIQFDLAFEGGISIVNDGEYYDVFLGSRTSSRNHSAPECSVQPDGSLRVVILSLQNKLFSGTEGDVATISLDLTGVVDGTYAYQIKNIALSDPASQLQYPADFEGSIIVGTGVTEGLGAVIAHGIANSALGQFVTWNGPIAATIAGALGVGGVASTVVGAIPVGKKASIAHSYNGVLKSRNKVRAANARSRELIMTQLGLQTLLRQKQDEMAAYASSPKDLDRLNKEVTKLRKKIASTSKKVAKASNKETDRLVDEVKKIAKLNRKEKKHDHRVAGSKSINKKGYTQKYIDLLTKRRAGQITQKEYEEQLAAIPVQYRNTKYTTFATELQMDLTENRQTTQAAKDVRAGKKPDPSAGFPDFEEDKEL